MPDAELVLAGEAASAPAARQFLRRTLSAWDLQVAEYVASQLLGELVANAVLHARGEFTVRLRRVAAGVRIEVQDRSPRLPTPRHYTADSGTGRGLALVERLSSRWGWEPAGPGKVVWCEMAGSDPPSGEEATAAEAAILELFADAANESGSASAFQSAAERSGEPADSSRTCGIAA